MRPAPRALWSLFLGFLAAAVTGCPGDTTNEVTRFDAYANDVEQEPYDDYYPEDTEPPEGTAYASKLTPLPVDLSSLPNRDRRYINHVFAQVLALAKANMVATKGLGTRGQVAALDGLITVSEETEETLANEILPEGMEGFHQDLLSAVTLQRTYFQKAGLIADERMAPVLEQGAGEIIEQRERETALKAIEEQVVEGTAASARLVAAWTKLQERYQGRWTEIVRESLYQHLRILDL